MRKPTFRITDEAAKVLESRAKRRDLGLSKYLELVLSWPETEPGEGGEEKAPEKLTTIAEELELPNGLLKIARDEEGLPEGFVRAKVSAGWTKIDWRKLALQDVEFQGLKRDKLAEEVKKIRASRMRIENRLPASARHQLNEEEDRAEVPNWCKKCRVSLTTRDELEAHKQGCGVGSLEYVVGLPEVK